MATKRNVKGGGSITKLYNGHYKMTITIGVGADGKQKRKAVTAKTKTELMKKVHELRVSSGKTTGEKMYFKDVVKMYLDNIEGTLRDNTFRGYRRTIDVVFSPLYDYRIDKITSTMIDNILDSLRKRDGSPLSPTSIKNHKGRLSSVFKFALERNLIEASPMQKTKKRRSTQKKVDWVAVPNETQMQRILQEAKEEDYGTPEGDFKVYPLLLLAVATGARLGELLDIDRLHDIDLENNTINIDSQVTREGANQPLKTSSSHRRIYVQPEILRAVLELTPRSDKTTKLWVHHGRHVTYMAASMKVHKFISKSTEIPKGFTFHCFRHYHATYLLMHGVNIKEVSKRLGHSSITTTLDLYAHWVPEMDATAANTIGTKFII